MKKGPERGELRTAAAAAEIFRFGRTGERRRSEIEERAWKAHVPPRIVAAARAFGLS